MLQFLLFFLHFSFFSYFFSHFYVVQEPDTDGYFKERADADPYFKSNTASQYFSQAAALQSAYGNMSQGQFYFWKFVTIICSHTDIYVRVFFPLTEILIRIFPFREVCHPGLTRVSSIRFLLFEIKRVWVYNLTIF